MQRSLLELQAETSIICKGMFHVEGECFERTFNLQTWMQKMAGSKQCKRATWQNGRVIELVLRS